VKLKKDKTNLTLENSKLRREVIGYKSRSDLASNSQALSENEYVDDLDEEELEEIDEHEET
jgi:hypothetical protein